MRELSEAGAHSVEIFAADTDGLPHEPFAASRKRESRDWVGDGGSSHAPQVVYPVLVQSEAVRLVLAFDQLLNVPSNELG